MSAFGAECRWVFLGSTVPQTDKFHPRWAKPLPFEGAGGRSHIPAPPNTWGIGYGGPPAKIGPQTERDGTPRDPRAILDSQTLVESKVRLGLSTRLAAGDTS